MEDYYYESLDDHHDSDYYDDAEYMNILTKYSHFEEEISVFDVYKQCIVPSFIQISNYILIFISINFAFFLSTKLVCYSPKLSGLRHLVNIFFGLYLVYETIEIGHLYVIQLISTTYILFIVLRHFTSMKTTAAIISIYTVLNSIVCELLEKDKKTWHHIRGVSMIASMKIISLVFDVKNNKILLDQLTVTSYFGYMFSPANTILGPWVSFEDYVGIGKIKMNLQYFVHIFINIFLSIIFFLISSCGNSLVDSEGLFKWFRAYFDALSFRTSHYFISFLSQAILTTAGHPAKSIEQSKSKGWFKYSVTNPLAIELPRSLVNVVIAWNTPMHFWLKQYIFRNIKHYGSFVAILTTYIVSSLLHGLNFQLSATLLTIGLWTYVEYKLRDKLSQIFSACILVTKCPTKCSKHKLQNSSVFTMIINFMFSMITVINLAYLGVMFNASFQLQKEGFSVSHALSKWSELDYAVHWLTLFTYIFYVII